MSESPPISVPCPSTCRMVMVSVWAMAGSSFLRTKVIITLRKKTNALVNGPRMNSMLRTKNMILTYRVKTATRWARRPNLCRNESIPLLIPRARCVTPLNSATTFARTIIVWLPFRVIEALVNIRPGTLVVRKFTLWNWHANNFVRSVSLPRLIYCQIGGRKSTKLGRRYVRAG